MNTNQIDSALSTVEAFIEEWTGARCEGGEYDPASTLRDDLHDGEGCLVCDAWATLDHLKRQSDSAKELYWLGVHQLCKAEGERT